MKLYNLSENELLEVPETLLLVATQGRITQASLFVCFWRDSPQWARASSFTRFLDHTQ